MVKIVCLRCNLGNVDASSARPGWGVCCAPDPDIAADIAADAAHRHEEALKRAAASGWGVGAVEPPPKPSAGRSGDLTTRYGPRTPSFRTDVDPMLGPVTWMVGTDVRTVAHLFVVSAGDQLAGRSVCEAFADDGSLRIAPRGRRGCRPCALRAGVIDDMAEMVTT